MKFDEIHQRGLKFSTTVNDNINIQKYQYIWALYLVTFSAAVGQMPRSTERISCIKRFATNNNGNTDIDNLSL